MRIRTPHRAAVVLSLLALTVLPAGCPNGGILLPIGNVVRVIVVNRSALNVLPDIRFDDDTSFLAGLFPSERLTTGTLLPGERFNRLIDCDQLGSIFSNDSEQDVGGVLVTADESRVLTREDDFSCGDTIEFDFVGEGDTFGVVVSINGIVVD